MDTASDALALVRRVLEAAGLVVDDVGDRQCMTMLSGEWKRTIPVLFSASDRSLQVTSLLAGRPDEAHGEVHALLLHRNQRARHVHFALDDTGNIVLRGRVPLPAVDSELLGELLGEVLATSDEVFNKVLRTGFASYLATEQAWRAARGLPPNPAGTKG